jgi:hypothetical protein
LTEEEEELGKLGFKSGEEDIAYSGFSMFLGG